MKALRCLIAAALALPLFADPSVAAADSFFPPLANPSPAKPGELSFGEGALLTVAAFAAVAPPSVAAAFVDHKPPEPIPRGASIGFLAGGLSVGLVSAAVLSSRKSDGANLMYGLVSGLYLGVAGTGVGGLAAPDDWRAVVLGTSTGLVTGAGIVGVISAARGRSNQGAGGAELVLGGVGGIGCLGVAASAFSDGRKEYGGAGIGCTALALVTTIHGLVQLFGPAKPSTSVTEPRWSPQPWVGRGSGGIMVRGAF